MKKFFLAGMLLCSSLLLKSQTVGIGTSTPDTNAVMDIFSAKKALILPRLADTGVVTNPSEGMVIYSKNTKSPSFHNGTSWQTLASMNNTLATGDSITYTITGGGGTTAGPFPVLNIADGFSLAISSGAGGTSIGKVNAADFQMSKMADINSLPLQQAVFKGTTFQSIEFKYYAPGSSTPYASTRLKNIYISSFQYAVTQGKLYENISIYFTNYGYKDLINNKEFGFDLNTNASSTY